MATAVKTLVDGAIAKEKVLVFSKTYCPYCVKGVRAFLEWGCTYRVHRVRSVEEKK
jgi:hypothetical protein